MLSVSKYSIGGKLTPEATRILPASWMSAGSISAISVSFSNDDTEASLSLAAGPASSGAAHPAARTASVARAGTKWRGLMCSSRS